MATATEKPVDAATAAALAGDKPAAKKANLRPAPKQLSFEVGGAKPDTSILKVKSSEITLDAGTQHKKGDTFVIELEVRIDELTFADKYDAHGNVSETKRLHVARVVSSSEDADDDGRPASSDDDED